MLDDRNIDRKAPVSPKSPVSPERHAIDPVAASSLAETWTALFARLTGRGRAAVPAERAAAPAGQTGPETGSSALRAEARAAYRAVEGGAPEAALEAALGVMERRIAELRKAVLAYGEGLKTIEVYSADDASRAAARTALRAAPERLAVGAPAPHFAYGGHHG